MSATPSARDRPGSTAGSGTGAATPASATPGDVLADACARYADLVLLQLEALAAEDLAAFEECAAAREAMTARIESAHAQGSEQPSPPPAAAAAHLARAADADRLVLERLLALRAQAAAALLEHDERRPRVLAYGSAAPREHGALDISL